MRFTALLNMKRVKVSKIPILPWLCNCNIIFLTLTNIYNLQLLGRTINLRSLISERMNKLFRDNLEFLFDRFESQDLCAIVVSNSNFYLLCHSSCYLMFFCLIYLGVGEASGNLKNESWILVAWSHYRFIQYNAKWDDGKCLSCFLLKSTCFSGINLVIILFLFFCIT